jgi:hypothetical protein
METISSGQTLFLKRIFPAIWLIAAVGMGVALASASLASRNFNPIALIGPVFMLVIFAIFYRKLICDLADEVRDGGSFLVVRRGAVEDRVQLSNVMNVSMSQFTNPPRLSLRLRTPGKFGDEVVFVPKMPSFQFNRFARNAVAENLIQRVDRARQER